MQGPLVFTTHREILPFVALFDSLFHGPSECISGEQAALGQPWLLWLFVRCLQGAMTFQPQMLWRDMHAQKFRMHTTNRFSFPSQRPMKWEHKAVSEKNWTPYSSEHSMQLSQAIMFIANCASIIYNIYVCSYLSVLPDPRPCEQKNSW